MTRSDTTPGPEKGEGLRCATSSQALKTSTNTDSTNFDGSRDEAQTLCALALRRIAGEIKADEFIQALRDGVKQNDDLAPTLQALNAGEFGGFCRTIAKALGVRHAA